MKQHSVPDEQALNESLTSMMAEMSEDVPVSAT